MSTPIFDELFVQADPEAQRLVLDAFDLSLYESKVTTPRPAGVR